MIWFQEPRPLRGANADAIQTAPSRSIQTTTQVGARIPPAAHPLRLLAPAAALPLQVRKLKFSQVRRTTK